MGHTPGPWIYRPPHHVGGAAINPQQGPSICSFWNENPDLRTDEEHESNGYLIAAAPELLEACEAWIHGQDRHKRIQYGRPWEQEAYEQTKAAIAKARGGGPPCTSTTARE